MMMISVVGEHGLQGAQASVVAVFGLRSCGSRALEHRLNSCGAWARLLHGIWDLPGSEMELVFFLHWQADSLSLNHQGSPYCNLQSAQ